MIRYLPRTGRVPCTAQPRARARVAPRHVHVTHRRPTRHGILSEEKTEQRQQLVEMLKKAYFMELETVINYQTMSINPDGLRAMEVKEALQTDIQEELSHAALFAQRIKTLYGTVPGSMDFKAEQVTLQPPDDQTDLVQIIAGVIDAENGAIDHYNQIIEFTEGIDPVTNDMVIAILQDEEQHRRLFEGFMREFERYSDPRTTADQ
jgi:bacterioferritin